MSASLSFSASVSGARVAVKVREAMDAFRKYFLSLFSSRARVETIDARDAGANGTRADGGWGSAGARMDESETDETCACACVCFNRRWKRRRTVFARRCAWRTKLRCVRLDETIHSMVAVWVA